MNTDQKDLEVLKQWIKDGLKISIDYDYEEEGIDLSVMLHLEHVKISQSNIFIRIPE